VVCVARKYGFNVNVLKVVEEEKQRPVDASTNRDDVRPRDMKIQNLSLCSSRLQCLAEYGWAHSLAVDLMEKLTYFG
jgi:hypothetical protein